MKKKLTPVLMLILTIYGCSEQKEQIEYPNKIHESKPIITTETNITKLGDHDDLRSLISPEFPEDAEVKVITHTYKTGTDTNHFGAIEHALSIGETNMAREIFNTYSELGLRSIPKGEVDKMRVILDIK